MRKFLASQSLGMKLLIGLMLVVAIGILYWVEPTQTSWLPKCMLHQSTGLHCPGCGATRAVHALLHGQWIAALRFNPLLIVGGPIMFAAIWLQSLREREGRPALPAIPWILFALVIVYFVARNVPSPSTSPFAPPVSTTQ
ncbi:MAG: DUF2752 domain-containing protein [Pirellulaceae bacterium]